MTPLRPFARHYDTIYHDKDYARDVRVLAGLVGLSSADGFSLLEVGAGTGNHSVLLSRLVETLCSVEIDTDFYRMLHAKVSSHALTNVVTSSEKLESASLGHFHAACALFHVVNYITPRDLRGFVRGLARHMVAGARFAADLWNLDAVLRDPPRREERHKSSGPNRIIQRINPHLDVTSREVRIEYDISVESDAAAERVHEVLQLYIWDRDELTDIFREAGFKEPKFTAYPDADKPPNATRYRQWLVTERS